MLLVGTFYERRKWDQISQKPPLFSHLNYLTLFGSCKFLSGGCPYTSFLTQLFPCCSSECPCFIEQRTGGKKGKYTIQEEFCKLGNSQFFRYQIARRTTSTGSLLQPFSSYKVKFHVYKHLGKRGFKLCLLFQTQVVGQVRKLLQMNFSVFSYLEHVVNEIY